MPTLRGADDDEENAVSANPLGRWGLPVISSLRAVVDVKTSTSVSRLDLAGKTHRRWSQFRWYRSLDDRRHEVAVLIVGAGLVGSQVARILVERGERPILMDWAIQPQAPRANR